MSTSRASGQSLPDEASLRADQGKQRRYEKLLDSDVFMDVVEANRAYVTAAISDPVDTERERWALSCLPGWGNVFTRLSISRMETFVLTKSGPDEPTGVAGYVVVARSALQAEFGSLARFGAEFPDLRLQDTGYKSAGDDQIGVVGGHGAVVAALWHEPFASAARALAERLLQQRTPYGHAHNYLLADHVLGRL